MFWLPSKGTFMTKFHLTKNVSRTFFLPLQNNLPFLEYNKRKQVIQRLINFDSGNYLNMWVTFDVFTCNRMIKLKIASKRSELQVTVTIRWLIWKLEHLVNTSWLAILMITVCWGNLNVIPHAGTFHLTCTIKCYEITLEKCICVGRTIVNTVQPRDKNEWFPVSTNIWEKMW